jgi:uncharacterized protein (TIGR03083 family)
VTGNPAHVRRRGRPERIWEGTGSRAAGIAVAGKLIEAAQSSWVSWSCTSVRWCDNRSHVWPRCTADVGRRSGCRKMWWRNHVQRRFTERCDPARRSPVIAFGTAGAARPVLRSLDSADWAKPTVCPGWNVHDITAHILNCYLRRISGSRDGHRGAVFADDETLPTHLARVNDEFVRAMRQSSPETMIDLLTHLGPQLDAVWAVVDPTAAASLNVSWAGTGTSPAWLDIAREYTEYWVHQQQIRDAVCCPGADSASLLRPVLVTFLHAVPFALRAHRRPRGVALRLEITGPAGGRWAVVSDGAQWDLTTAPVGDPSASLRLDQDTLWRLASRGISVGQGLDRAELHGDRDLAEAAASLLAVVL